ncbi:MAG: hypothetical protein Q9193_005631 [Seirophora villosa]
MVFQDSHAVIFAAALLVVALSYHLVLYPLCISPLAKVPNAHWSSPLTSLWILVTRYRGQELHTVRQAHERLGPIVRLGPQDISISCFEDGIRTVYHGGFDKPPWFSFFNYYESENAFCSLTKESHSTHRRRIAAVYTKSALSKSPQLAAVTETILLAGLVPRMDNDILTSQQTDLLELSYSMCLDLVNAYLFGQSNGSKFLTKGQDIKSFLEHYEHRYCAESFWPQELPRFTRVLERVGVRLLPKRASTAKKWLESWMMAMCKAADATMRRAEKSTLENDADFPTVYASVRGATDQDSNHLDAHSKQSEVASELFDHMASSREVLGLVLAYALYYLSQKPAAQRRLREEIAFAAPEMHRPSSSNSPNLPSAATLDKLPYLSAIICESLRMRPNSTPLPRITPANASVRLAGIEGIPPGVRVNAFQWFVHRDAKKWDRVDEWIPERWLDSDGKLLKGSGESQLWGFCSGPRMCAGSNLSQYRQLLDFGLLTGRK